MSKLYIASFEAFLGQYHSYLVYENDLGEQFIIRGGTQFDLGFNIWDESTAFNFGNISLENNIREDLSEDKLSNDKTGNGLPDTQAERNYTELTLPTGETADSVWTQLKAYMTDLGAPDGQTGVSIFNYDLAGSNSNSVINSALASVGIDYRDNIPVNTAPTDYVGHLHLLDSSGDDTFTAYQYDGIFDTTVFHDNTGNDTIIVEDGAQVRVLNDEDINGSNTLVLQGVIDQNNIFLTQHLDDLWIYTRADSGSEWNRVAILDDHFDFVLNSGSGTDILQLSDMAGQIVGAFNIDQAILTPDQLGHIAPHSLFNTQYEITQLFFGQGITTTWDPLLIDLDGDGYEIKSRANSVYFDLDSDGYASSINWTELNSDDGWLVRDVNGNGRIDNGSELFGSDVLDGFSDLAQYDGNADGIIDASDAIWSDLLVWTDTNGDAQTLTAELHTLDSANDNTQKVYDFDQRISA